MNLRRAQRRAHLKSHARRLFLEIQTAKARPFRGPTHALHLATAERNLARIMRKLAAIDPAAAALIAEGEAVARDPADLAEMVAP